MPLNWSHYPAEGGKGGKPSGSFYAYFHPGDRLAGDCELFLILGRALRDRSHRVTLGTPGFYADRVRQAGLGWVQIGNSTRADPIDTHARAVVPSPRN